MEMRYGNLWKKILFYSIPLMITNLLQLLFNIADVAIVGKFAGALSLGAVGSTTLLVALTTGWLIGMSNGVNAMVAYYAGANDHRSESQTVHTGFLICGVTGILTLLLGFTLAGPVLALLGTKDELIREAVMYFRIYMLGSPALGIFNYGNGVLSAEGDTRKPLNYLTLSGVINIILNLIFVVGCGMTADGVAWASVISQYVSAAMILRALNKTEERYRLNLKALSWNASIAKGILRIGIPAASQYSLFSVANLFVQSAVNTFDHVVVEGNSAAMNFDSIVYDMMAAFYTACTSFTAQNYGAGKRERVSRTYLITTVYSFGLAAALGVLIHFFSSELLYLFTNDANVVAAGSIRLRILSITYCLSAFMDNATAACRGLGKTAVPTAIVLLGTIVFRIVWIYTVFAHFRTLESLYILYGCAFILTAVFLNIYYARLFRSEMRITRLT